MNLKNYLLLALFGLLLSSCYNDEKVWDALNEQEKRIEALEDWQKVVNENINALHALVAENDYITSVTPITMNSDTIGYTISFKNQPSVSIYNGKKGEQGDKGDKGETGSTPKISLTQQKDGNWYWTLNGELMKDSKGNAIRANGQDGVDGKPGEDGSSGTSAPVPQLKSGSTLKSEGISEDAEGKDIISDAIYLSVNVGKTWTKVSGEDGEQGDAIFKDVKIEDDRVIFTLTENPSNPIIVPLYSSFTLCFDSYQTTMVTIVDFPLTVKLPEDLTQANYKCLMATITPTNGSININTRATSGWSVNITQTNFEKHFAIVTVRGDKQLLETNDQALLSVILTYENGRQVTASRLVEFISPIGDKTPKEAEVLDFYMKDGTLVSKDKTLSQDQKDACIGIVFWKEDSDQKIKKDNYGLLDKKFPKGIHGLVVSLWDMPNLDQDQKESDLIMEWTYGGYEYVDDWLGSQNGVTCTWNGRPESFTNIQKTGTMQGYANTIALKEYNMYIENPENKKNQNFRVKPVNFLDAFEEDHSAPSTSSGWYWPSVYELKYVCWGQGNEEGPSGKNELNKQIEEVGKGDTFGDNSYWSSTESGYNSGYKSATALYVYFGFGGVYERGSKDYYTYRVRPLLAF